MFYKFTEERLVDYMEMSVSSLQRLTDCGQMCFGCLCADVQKFICERLAVSLFFNLEPAIA